MSLCTSLLGKYHKGGNRFFIEKDFIEGCNCKIRIEVVFPDNVTSEQAGAILKKFAREIHRNGHVSH